MGRQPKSYRPKPVEHAVLSGLLVTAIDLLKRRHRGLSLKMSGIGLTDCERAELVEIDALMGKRDSIFAATVPVPRNQRMGDTKWTPGPASDFRDPAPMKNPLRQRAVLGRRVEAVRFASDNPIGSTPLDDTAPIQSGSSMAETDSPPWE